MENKKNSIMIFVTIILILLIAIGIMAWVIYKKEDAIKLVKQEKDAILAEESTTDIEMEIIAKDVFERTIESIITYTLTNVKYPDEAYGCNFEERHPQNAAYVKSPLKYEVIEDRLSREFTGTLYEYILDHYFLNKNGDLYCLLGGQSGFGVENVVVSQISSSENEYQYEATFDYVEAGDSEEKETTFTIKLVNGYFLISDISWYLEEI